MKLYSYIGYIYLLRKMKIVNLTQHGASPEQKAQGVVEPEDKALVQSLLTFDTIPSKEEMAERAEALARVATSHDTDSAMIGGAPYFMSVLENTLKAHGVKPVYAFSVRESADVPQADGSVRKVAVFRHLGFVEV